MYNKKKKFTHAQSFIIHVYIFPTESRCYQRFDEDEKHNERMFKFKLYKLNCGK